VPLAGERDACFHFRAIRAKLELGKQSSFESSLLKRNSAAQARLPRRRSETTQEAGPVWSADRVRRLLLGGLTAVYVARPLLASESPTTIAGDGLPFVMLTLILVAVWLVTELAEPRGVRFGVAEGAWLALIVWFAVSAYAASRGGYARAAINGFWEWAGLGLGYLLLRQLLYRDDQKRALTIVMIGVALVLSLDGLYQFFIELPQARELYRVDPDKMLLEARVNAPPGSAARILFEQRLASTEPAATFSLANSLAGFLTPWLLMTTAIGWLGHDRAAGSANWRCLAGAAASALPVAACLVLTKSRAGYLATLLGFATLVLCSLRKRSHAWLFAAGLAVVVLMLMAGGLAVGSLDRQVLSEAFKSLAYRWHYWHGALGIVAEHPWLGCGPDNFQDEYTRFKLPEASEVVADPHNFAFEIWATAGTPALLAFIAILIAAASPWRPASSNLPQPQEDEPQRSLRASKSTAHHLPAAVTATASGIVGFLLALAIGLFSTVGLPWLVFAVGCIVLPAVVVCFGGWIRRGDLPTYVPFVAALALLVNLLVAGGISFAGVAGTLWLLFAVGASENRSRRRLPPSLLMGLCVANAALFIACYFSAYRPVLGCRRLTALALRERSDARQRLVAAAAADPLADEPWHLLAEGDFNTWLRDPSAESATWEKDQQEVLQRRPHSSAAWQEAGERYLTAYHESQDDQRKRFLSAAIDHLRSAAELYPNSALVHAKLALALATADDNRATEQAAIAIELHEKTPHEDQKLPRDLLNATQQLKKGRPSNAQD
jgi:hypothetical protein